MTNDALRLSAVADLDWDGIAASLDATGYAVTPPLLSPQDCGQIGLLYDDPGAFRRRVVMERHGYGQGEYQYFAYPLPPLVGRLRAAFYARLAPIANDWAARLREDARYPATLEAFLERCHAAAQLRPTPLLLRYGPGGYNCLHQDLYGPLVFPLQVVFLLSAPGADFSGGELVLVEQRPRAQSQARVVPLGQGQAVIFAVRHRPAPSRTGFRRVALRHGVSPLHSGTRQTLGLIFHDAA